MGNQVSYSLDVGNHHFENKASINTTAIVASIREDPAQPQKTSDSEPGSQQVAIAAGGNAS